MKPWEIPYTCHIVPFSEKECQPNVKREGNDTLGSEENNFPPPHPHFTIDFSPSLHKPQFLLLSSINCQYVGQNYLNIFASFSIF